MKQKKSNKISVPRFVIQKHDATRLHYDFRLENKRGDLISWAVPKGLSLDPSVKRLAIMTEDHPGSYIDFEGQIPKGNYGAGRVIVWDIGNYQTNKDIDEQVKEGKIKVNLYGKKVKGSFSLVKLKNGDNQWLITKSRDQHASLEQIVEVRPESVLTGATIESMPDPRTRPSKPAKTKGTPREFPKSIKPMLAMPIDEPFDNKDWVFEVKWDGVRALLFRNKSGSLLQIQSRKGGDITQRYPEIAKIVDSKVNCVNSIVLDGEIVILNKEGMPDFQRHQKRMNVDKKREVEVLSRTLPATYYVFDILYLDGLSLEKLSYVERREILSKVIIGSGSRIKISDYIEEQGKALFENAIKLKLEGIVAKHKSSPYQQGSRSAAWLKIKGVITQDCVVIGYTRGEGSREGYFGSLILAVYDNNKLEFVGHSGSGFNNDQLGQTLQMMQKLAVDKCPVEHVPYVNREPVWLKPELVAEVKFNGWTQERIMRAPIFVRFREDKKPEECIIEAPKNTQQALRETEKVTQVAPRVPAISVSNPEKVFWPQTEKHRALKKDDLINYYASVAEYILPHLVNRPLSLSRYPDGILGKSFYHKNWDKKKPDYVRTIKVFSESSQRIINYIMCNNKETLLWLANLGCIEMHPWYSRVHDYSVCSELAKIQSSNTSALDEGKCGLEIPDFIVFDLDPYIYSGKEKRGQEPEYNKKGFKAAVEVAHDLNDLLQSLRIKSYVKTSGKTGLHIFVPVAPLYTYEHTRGFAELVGKILSRKSRKRITMEWDTSKRKGKVFFDHNQNAKGKTIASILSARPTRSATVSMPVEWQQIDSVLPTDFSMENVPQLIKQTGDPWKDILSKPQDLAKILDNVSEIAF